MLNGVGLLNLEVVEGLINKIDNRMDRFRSTFIKDINMFSLDIKSKTDITLICKNNNSKIKVFIKDIIENKENDIYKCLSELTDININTFIKNQTCKLSISRSNYSDNNITIIIKYINKDETSKYTFKLKDITGLLFIEE